VAVELHPRHLAPPAAIGASPASRAALRRGFELSTCRTFTKIPGGVKFCIFYAVI
jgi:hypothetical protein